MALAKRMAVTLPAGPKVEHTVDRIRWAEDNGYDDAWFGDSIAPHQHLEIARMRSLEFGRAALRSTNTGISAFIAADGELLQTGRQFTPEPRIRRNRASSHQEAR